MSSKVPPLVLFTFLLLTGRCNVLAKLSNVPSDARVCVNIRSSTSNVRMTLPVENSSSHYIPSWISESESRVSQYLSVSRIVNTGTSHNTEPSHNISEHHTIHIHIREHHTIHVNTSAVNITQLSDWLARQD